MVAQPKIHDLLNPIILLKNLKAGDKLTLVDEKKNEKEYTVDRIIIYRFPDLVPGVTVFLTSVLDSGRNFLVFDGNPDQLTLLSKERNREIILKASGLRSS